MKKLNDVQQSVSWIVIGAAIFGLTYAVALLFCPSGQLPGGAAQWAVVIPITVPLFFCAGFVAAGVVGLFDALRSRFTQHHNAR